MIMPCPTIAVLDGPVLGGGLELAIRADLRVASKNCTFALPECAYAIMPGNGGTSILPRLIGESRAKELVFIAD